MENPSQPGNYAFAFHEAIVSYLKDVAPKLPELLFEEFVDVVKLVAANNTPAAVATFIWVLRVKHPLYVKDQQLDESDTNDFYGWLSKNESKHRLSVGGAFLPRRCVVDIVDLIDVNLAPLSEAINEINTQPDAVPSTVGEFETTTNGRVTRVRKRRSAVPDPLEEE